MSALAQDFISQLQLALRRAGTHGQLVRPGAALAPRDVVFLLDHPRTRDEAIVNAYGVNALLLTFLASELMANPPIKFDLVSVGAGPTAQTYALDAVVMRQVQDVPVAFTAYVKGKGQ